MKPGRELEKTEGLFLLLKLTPSRETIPIPKMSHSLRSNSTLVVSPKGSYVTSPNLISYPLPSPNWQGRAWPADHRLAKPGSVLSVISTRNSNYSTWLAWAADRLDS